MYVGKAKNLRHRLSSYAQLKRLTPRILQLVTTAQDLHYQTLLSELEAILTEAELIRTYQPDYNILLKDDKSPLYVAITTEKYPRVIQLRKKQLVFGQTRPNFFGPFASSYQVQQVLKIARPIFRWCDDPTNTKGCFYSHLDLCSGVCCGKISATEYQLALKQLLLFLHGKSTDLLKELKLTMKQQAKLNQFEAAAKTRDMIRAVTAVTREPYYLMPDPQLLSLADHQPDNQLTYLNRLLQLYLGLPKQSGLKKIEGYDVSNTSGTNAAVALVSFADGQANPADYRLFNIRSLDTPNDYQMLREALIRRQNHPEWGIPDLIIIDGGKGQLRAVMGVWQWPTPIMSIAKRPDRLIFPRIDRSAARLKISYSVVSLDASHPGLQLVQQIRDEAHRFSKKQHSRLRTRKLLK